MDYGKFVGRVADKFVTTFVLREVLQGRAY